MIVVSGFCTHLIPACRGQSAYVPLFDLHLHVLWLNCSLLTWRWIRFEEDISCPPLEFWSESRKFHKIFFQEFWSRNNSLFETDVTLEAMTAWESQLAYAIPHLFFHFKTACWAQLCMPFTQLDGASIPGHDSCWDFGLWRLPTHIPTWSKPATGETFLEDNQTWLVQAMSVFLIAWGMKANWRSSLDTLEVLNIVSRWFNNWQPMISFLWLTLQFCIKWRSLGPNSWGLEIIIFIYSIYSLWFWMFVF